jgi:hypothetical protein
MKVEKIDIKKEVMEIPDNRDRVDFAIREPLRLVMNEGEMPLDYDMVSGRETYLVQKLSDPFRKEVRHYLVKVDQRELFNDIIHIQDGLINEKITDAVAKAGRDWLNYDLPKLLEKENRRTRGTIKQMPWYRRLFKKF